MGGDDGDYDGAMRRAFEALALIVGTGPKAIASGDLRHPSSPNKMEDSRVFKIRLLASASLHRCGEAAVRGAPC